MPDPVKGNLCPHCGGEGFELRSPPGPDEGSVINRCIGCDGFAIWRQDPDTGVQSMEALTEEPTEWRR